MRGAAVLRLKQNTDGGSVRRELLTFLGQIALVASVELADEFARGMIAQSDSRVGALHAGDVLRFEVSHGFWWEPNWQLFFERTHHLLGVSITWEDVIPLANGIYLFGHILITFTFALWLFMFRRGIFAFVRNIFFATNAIALVVYETYPLAPPRLATNLTFNGHAFHFVDTMWQVLGANGKVVGTQIGYNELAAMPSLHFGWALIVAVGLAWTVQSLPLRLLALTYPAIMLVIVVITGNHFIMDAIGATAIVVLAICLAILHAWWRAGWGPIASVLRHVHSMRSGHAASGTASDAPVRDHQAVA